MQFCQEQVNFYTVDAEDETQRLDNLLTRLLKGVPKSHIYRIIRGGEVRVNKKRAEVSYKVNCGDVIRIPPITTKNANSVNNDAGKNGAKKIGNSLPIANKNIGNFPLVFEDDHYIVIDKPDGIACHGGSGVSLGVIEQMRLKYPKLKFLELVHRLDKDTSGLLILAKKRQALVLLQDLIRKREMEKIYLALTKGVWRDKRLTVKAPLFVAKAVKGERKVRVDKENGQYAHTDFKVLQGGTNCTLVEAVLQTGRTHQIRVHLQHIGHHILGDRKYGDFEANKQIAASGLKRMFLHALKVRFIHPITQEKLELIADLPESLKKLTCQEFT